MAHSQRRIAETEVNKTIIYTAIFRGWDRWSCGLYHSYLDKGLARVEETHAEGSYYEIHTVGLNLHIVTAPEASKITATSLRLENEELHRLKQNGHVMTVVVLMPQLSYVITGWAQGRVQDF